MLRLERTKMVILQCCVGSSEMHVAFTEKKEEWRQEIQINYKQMQMLVERKAVYLSHQFFHEILEQKTLRNMELNTHTHTHAHIYICKISVLNGQQYRIFHLSK